MKTCTKCKQVLSHEEFYDAPHHKDGLTSQCWKCIEAYRYAKRIQKRAKATAVKYELARTVGKKCRVCNEVKPASSFYDKKESSDKLSYECKTCVAHYRIAYKQTERGREITRINNRRWKHNYKLSRPDDYHSKYVLYAHNYRARQKNADPNFTVADWREVLEKYNHRCAYCGGSDKKLTVEHVVALDNGGSHNKDNIVPACGPCNFRKHTRALNLFTIQK